MRIVIRLRRDIAAAFLAGGVAAVLLLGALAFEYWGGLPPCEMCLWQRWPHLAAAFLGLGGGMLILAGLLAARAAAPLALAAALAIAISGGIGVYHAGVEWRWWEGPASCTATGFKPGPGIAFEPIPVTGCDEAAWRLFGLSLAGYNAILSFAVAGATLLLLWRRKKARP